MSKVQTLRTFVHQRLTAAAEEIFGLFERTIAEYEEELRFRSKESHRQLKLMDAADRNPKVRLQRAASSRLCSPKRGPLPVLPSVCPHRVPPPTPSTPAWSAGPYQPLMSVTPPMLSQYSASSSSSSSSTSSCLSVLPSRDNEQHMGPTTHHSYKDVQQLLMVEEDVPPEQQEWSSSLDQEDPEPMYVKEEQGVLWTSQEGEQLQWLEEADIKFQFTSVPVKSEEGDEEKDQSSQLHESQTEANREAERTGADGEDWGGPEPARNSDLDSLLQPATHGKTADSSESETDDSGDWEESRSGANPLQNCEVPGSDEEPLKKRTGVETGGKPFCCLVCGKRFFLNKTLTAHMRLHSEGNHFSCPVCKLVSGNRITLVKHMRIHTGEKQFNCSLCSKQFAQREHLRRHLIVHKGNKPFSCSVCSKTFTQKGNLKKHMAIHTGEKPFSCSFCSKRFTQKGNLKQHLAVHTGEKPFSCSVCGERFTQKGHLKQHLSVHTEEIIMI